MIQWYPGHMVKAKREMQKRLALADVVIEILDARSPEATRNPDLDEMFKGKPRIIVLNKEDMAKPAVTAKWLAHYHKRGFLAVAFCAVNSGKHAALFHAVDEATAKAVQKWAQKGAVKPVRAMVVGIPNVGKSSVINALSGSKRTRVGAAPGVTRGQQWVRISPRMELLDTPGVLWPKFEDERVALRLAFINAIRDEVLEPIPLAQKLIETLKTVSPDTLQKRFKLDDEQGEPPIILLAIAKARGCILRGGEWDTERAAHILLDEFSRGKLGRISLEMPPEGKTDETKGD